MEQRTIPLGERPARLWTGGKGDAIVPLHGGWAVGERIERALDGFALRRLADVPGRMLSAGQKRRLNLARLLAAPAPLVRSPLHHRPHVTLTSPNAWR